MRYRNFTIDDATESDVEAIYAVSLKTGLRGEDASHIYADGKMMGHIYSVPYVRLAESFCLVVRSTTGVVGFVVGTNNTGAFEASAEANWWPSLREIYTEPDVSSAMHWTHDQKRAHMLHHPVPAPDEVVIDFPAHMHLNLLPEARRCGVGRYLAELAIRRFDLRCVHVGVNNQNIGALAFWNRLGFQRIELKLNAPSRTLWLGRSS